MRPVDQPLQAARLVLSQPGMQRLPRHPDRRLGLDDRPTALITESTACKASTEGELSGLSRRHTPVRELATRLELVTCCFSAAGIGGLWRGAIVWRLA